MAGSERKHAPTRIYPIHELGRARHRIVRTFLRKRPMITSSLVMAALLLVGPSLVHEAGAATSFYWNTTGNAGSTPSTNFIGTTDNQPLAFRTNNAEAMRINSSGYVGIGTTNPTSRL